MTLARAVILGSLQGFMVALLIALLITGIDLVPALRSGIPGGDRSRLVGAVLILGAPLLAGLNAVRLRPQQPWASAAISGAVLALFATACLMAIDALRAGALRWAASYGLAMIVCALAGAGLRVWWHSRIAAHERLRKENLS